MDTSNCRWSTSKWSGSLQMARCATMKLNSSMTAITITKTPQYYRTRQNGPIIFIERLRNKALSRYTRDQVQLYTLPKVSSFQFSLSVFSSSPFSSEPSTRLHASFKRNLFDRPTLFLVFMGTRQARVLETLGVPVVALGALTDSARLWAGPSKTATLSV